MGAGSSTAGQPTGGGGPSGGAPAAGKVLFEDDFVATRQWSEGAGAFCRTSYGDGGYVVEATSENGCMITLLRAGEFRDAVRIELTAQLRGGPMDYGYGFTFGVGEEGRRSYAFMVSGDGHYRLTGPKEDLTPWTKDAGVRTGVGAVNRLAVEIQGRTLLGFVNGRQVLSVTAPADVAGHVGLNVRHLGMVVVYSALRVSETRAGAGAGAPSGPRVVYADDLKAQRRLFVGTRGACRTAYTDGGLSVTGTSAQNPCEFMLSDAGVLEDRVRIEATVRVVRGPLDRGFGLKFGDATDSGVTYTFIISGERGRQLSHWNQNWVYLAPWASHAAVAPGYGATNRLVVELDGRVIRASVNGTTVATAEALAPVRGGLGFYVDAAGLEVLFSDVQVLELARPAR
jgi:hypothetical protein